MNRQLHLMYALSYVYSSEIILQHYPPSPYGDLPVPSPIKLLPHLPPGVPSIPYNQSNKENASTETPFPPVSPKYNHPPIPPHYNPPIPPKYNPSIPQKYNPSIPPAQYTPPIPQKLNNNEQCKYDILCKSGKCGWVDEWGFICCTSYKRDNKCVEQDIGGNCGGDKPNRYCASNICSRGICQANLVTCQDICPDFTPTALIYSALSYICIRHDCNDYFESDNIECNDLDRNLYVPCLVENRLPSISPPYDTFYPPSPEPSPPLPPIPNQPPPLYTPKKYSPSSYTSPPPYRSPPPYTPPHPYPPYPPSYPTYISLLSDNRNLIATLNYYITESHIIYSFLGLCIIINFCMNLYLIIQKSKTTKTQKLKYETELTSQNNQEIIVHDFPL